MPVSYSIDAASRTIFWEFDGVITEEELRTAVEALWSDPEYRPAYSRLVDTTNSSSARLSGEIVRWIARRDTRTGVGKFAFIAISDAMFGMARMFESYSEGISCQVFRSRSGALTWLAENEMPETQAANAGEMP